MTPTLVYNPFLCAFFNPWSLTYCNDPRKSGPELPIRVSKRGPSIQVLNSLNARAHKMRCWIHFVTVKCISHSWQWEVDPGCVRHL